VVKLSAEERERLEAMVRWDCLEIGGAGAEAVVSRLISDRG
jgi:hypothetical protein